MSIIKKIINWFKNLFKKKKIIIAIGDSGTAGTPFTNDCPSDSEDKYSWTNVVRENMHVKIHNKGIGGDTTQGVLNRLEKDVFEYKPDYCIIEVGGNDFNDWNGVPIDRVVSNIIEIGAKCLAENITPIYMTYGKVPVKYVSRILNKPEDDPSVLSLYIQTSALVERMRSICKLYDIKMIDVLPIVTNPDGSTNWEIIGNPDYNDAAHPNKEGYKRIGEYVVEELKEFID